MNTDEALYVNLKVLAQLQPYQRLNTRQTLFQVTPVETNNRLTEYLTHMPEWLKRWMEGSLQSLLLWSFKGQVRRKDYVMVRR